MALKYCWRPALEAGLQGFGEVGPWNDWAPKSQQSHIAGPALFGRVRASEHQTIRYNATLLFARTDDAPRRTVRLQAEYEFLMSVPGGRSGLPPHLRRRQSPSADSL